MRKAFTKTTALFMAVMLLLGSAAAGAGGFAQVLDTISVRASAEELKYGDLTYSVENGEVTITGCDENATKVEIPSEIDGCPVTSIGASAFSYCAGLTSINIPDSVTSIGNRAFRGCTGLTSVTIGKNVSKIGGVAFAYCTGLSSITVDSENPVYHSEGNCIIETAGKTLVTGCKTGVIPDDGSVTKIDYSAFIGCEGLESITIPSAVTTIIRGAFYGCTGLKSLNIPAGVTNIDAGSLSEPTFGNCSGLESITVDSENPVYHSAGNCLIETESKKLVVGCKNSVIPDDGSVTIIGEAFYGCTGLTSITIPDRVTSIFSRAFWDCTGLTSITIGNSVTSIDESAFYGCTGLKSVTIPDSVTRIGEAFSGCTGLESISVDANNPVYIGKGNCLIEKESKTLIDGCKNSIIPDDGSVTSIGEYAFCNCTGLTGITIPESVTSIGEGAFKGCTGLTGITIPKNVTSIGNRAFDGCTGLTSVTIPDSVTSIGDSAFCDCTGLTSLTIGNGVTSIGIIAFERCDNLKNVYYNGTEKDRENKVSIGYRNDCLLNATWHYTLFDNAKINVKSDEVYKNSVVTVTATAENVPDGYLLAVFDGGKDPVAKGDGKTVSYEIPGKLTSDKNLTVKVVDAENNTQKDGNGKDLSAEINIKVKTGFFDIIVAFFRMIFGMNKVAIKP